MKQILTLAAALLIGSSAAVAQQQFQIDHFKCYFPDQATEVQPATVLLEDQFFQNTAVIGRIFRFCNPAKKFHNGVVTPIQNPDDHMTLHQASPQPLITREVKIANQFGDQVLTTQDARFLIVPTQKAPHDPPKDLNHFNCYAVVNSPLLQIPIGLSDQFFASRHRVGRAILFCNPVQKTHNGVITPVTNRNDHLTCYNMTRAQFPRDVDLRNQFGDHHIHVPYADMTCVPTQKLSWRVVD